MRKVSKIIIICVLITITLSTILFLNKKEVKSNGMFAIMLEKEKGTGRYENAKDNKWPQGDEYVINMYKTYCEKGSVLRWNNETKRINATVKGTDKCYVYFDLSEYGNEEHPHLIQTIEDLVRLSNDVNNGTTYAGKYFLLTNDLDFQDESDYEDASRTDFKDINGINGDEALIKELTTGTGFKPIGNKEKISFQGNFNGNNKTIDNLYIVNNTDSNARLGLFGFLGGNTKVEIKNLTVSGEITSNVRATIGGIVGENWDASNVEIVNCVNKVNIESLSNEWNASGIIGNNNNDNNIKIINCQNYGNITGSANASGIIGYINGKLTIENCINYGTITNNVGHYTGGLLGSDSVSKNSSIIINNSHNEGIVKNDSKTSSSVVGGLMAYSFGDIEINDSYNIGDLTANGENGTFIGGLIGRIAKKITINNSYNVNNTLKIYPNGFNASEVNGGLIGGINNQTEISIIKNGYNTGEILNGTRVGGLIGSLESGIIIDKCYNAGNINVANEVWDSQSQIGGLIGAATSYYFFHPKDIILNSYNIGNMVTNNKNVTRIAGLLQNIHSNNTIILNSFNVGNLDLQGNFVNDSAVGLVYSTAKGLQNQSLEKNTNILNNVYNFGTINGVNSSNYSLGYFDLNMTSNNIQNTYYVNNVTGTSLTDVGTGMTLDQMKQQTFVDTLNKNVESINLEEIDSSLKDYKLSKWVLGKDGYPTLVNE